MNWHYKHLHSQIHSFFPKNIYWTFFYTRHHLQNKNKYITSLKNSMRLHGIVKGSRGGRCKHLCPFEMESREKPHNPFLHPPVHLLLWFWNPVQLTVSSLLLRAVSWTEPRRAICWLLWRKPVWPRGECSQITLLPEVVNCPSVQTPSSAERMTFLKGTITLYTDNTISLVFRILWFC